MPQGSLRGLLRWVAPAFHLAAALAFLLAWTMPGWLGAERVVDLTLLALFDLTASVLTLAFLSLFKRRTWGRRGAGPSLLMLGVLLLGLFGVVANSIGRAYLVVVAVAQLLAQWVPLVPGLRDEDLDDPKVDRTKGHVMVALATYYILYKLPVPPLGLGMADVTEATGGVVDDPAWLIASGFFYYATLAAAEAWMTVADAAAPEARVDPVD